MTKLSLLFGATVFVGCATTSAADAPPVPSPRAEVAPAVERVHSGTTLLRNGTVLTAAGVTHAPGHVLWVDGRIADVGAGDGVAPAGATIIDLAGAFVTPGIIDTHSHIGVMPSPESVGNDDGNEASSPLTPQVRSESGFWPQDPALWRALSGGITTMQILPGSANILGGRSFVVHLRPEVATRAMKFPGAPEGLKMACGENPKRTYGEKGGPATRMGSVAMLRQELQRAVEYRDAWTRYAHDVEVWTKRNSAPPATATPAPDAAEPRPVPPARDYGLETVVEVLEGKVLLHNHCYRADEMHQVLDIAKEFGFHVRSFHHAVEAYKLADRLAAEDVAVSTWVDWWGFKMESLDGVPQNVALVQRAGGRPILHSDSDVEIRHLNQEASKARAAGERFGLTSSDDQVLRWITANPAWALGLEKEIGTLEKGKRADVVVWSKTPFSVYSLAQKVFVDGELVYDRATHRVPVSDFELGHVDPSELP